MRLATHIQQTLQSAIQDARGREIAAFLIAYPDNRQEIWRVNNRSFMANQVVVLPSEVQRIEREVNRCGARILAFIHSHCYSLNPSDEDWVGISATRLPWIIVCKKGDSLQYQTYSFDVNSKRFND